MQTNIFFTADHHFDHANIIRYANRPFSSVVEMNEELINRWNSVVTNKDIVYHLGDFVFGKNEFDVDKYLSKLNGHINYIHGNHDSTIRRFFRSELYQKKYPLKILDLGKFFEISIGNQKITLCHYALKVWKCSHHGAWSLYGHSHGSLPDDINSLSIDVGVDCHNFTPISFEQIKEIMSKKNYKPIDHHDGTR